MADGMDLDLQKAIVTALRADSTFTGLVAGRLYEDVVPNPSFPYVTIGETQENDDSVQFLTASEMFVDIHVWTRDSGFSSCKAICDAIKATLDDQDLVLTDQRCVSILHRITRTFRDADMLTKHGVVTLVALTEET